MLIDSLDINEIKLQIVNFIKDSSVYICGVSTYGKLLAKWMELNGIKYDGFVDRKGTADWTDKTIYTYGELKTIDLINSKFVITQKYYRQEVENELIENGIDKQNILEFYDDATFECFYLDIEMDSGRDLFESDLNQFRNKYKNERCFVIGNGPSLLEEDIHKIKDEHTFSVNMMYENFERLKWRPDFYFIIDRVMSTIFEQDEQLFHKLLKNIGYFFAEEKTGLYSKYIRNKPDNLVFFKDISQRLDGSHNYHFSDDMVKGVFRGQTVIYDVLQAAVFMGFKEIILLGVDMNFKFERTIDGSKTRNNDIKRNHAKWISEPNLFETDAYEPVEEMLLGFKAAKKYADRNNIRIFNATNGGRLEIFPRIKLDEIIKKMI